jgi:hypothetical protein
MAEYSREFRFITYLSPGIPQAFFEAVVEHVRRTLGCGRTSLWVEERVSGPPKGVEDPFSRDEADVGFMCAPSFLWLRELRPPPVQLLGVAPVFADARASGRPVYFCDVVVRRDAPVQSFTELRERTWAYNDRCSLSGYYSLLNKLAAMGVDEGFLGRGYCSGKQLSYIQAVVSGEARPASPYPKQTVQDPPRLMPRAQARGSLSPPLRLGYLAALAVVTSNSPTMPCSACVTSSSLVVSGRRQSIT